MDTIRCQNPHSSLTTLQGFNQITHTKRLAWGLARGTQDMSLILLFPQEKVHIRRLRWRSGFKTQDWHSVTSASSLHLWAFSSLTTVRSKWDINVYKYRKRWAHSRQECKGANLILCLPSNKKLMKGLNMCAKNKGALQRPALLSASVPENRAKLWSSASPIPPLYLLCICFVSALESLLSSRLQWCALFLEYLSVPSYR